MSLQRFLFPACCFALGVLLAAWGLRPNTLAMADQQQPDPQSQSANARLAAAQTVYEGYATRMKQAQLDRRGLGHDLEFLCAWSRKWVEAESAIDKAKAKQVAAYAAHVDRIKSLEAMSQAAYKAKELAKYELAMVQYYRVEAEQWLAEAKGR